MKGKDVDDVGCLVVVIGEVDVGVEAVVVLCAVRVNAGDVVIFDIDGDVRQCCGLEKERVL